MALNTLWTLDDGRTLELVGKEVLIRETAGGDVVCVLDYFDDEESARSHLRYWFGVQA